MRTVRDCACGVTEGEQMINGAHFIIYSRDAEADRAFFRDVLHFPSVDAGGGWLIFALPPAELGVHPVERSAHVAGQTELYLMCHDLTRTREQLEAKGVEFTTPVSDEGFGLRTRFR